MTDFARTRPCVRAWSSPGRLRPSRPAIPTWSTSRRRTPSQSRRFSAVIRSMGGSVLGRKNKKALSGILSVPAVCPTTRVPKHRLPGLWLLGVGPGQQVFPQSLGRRRMPAHLPSAAGHASSSSRPGASSRTQSRKNSREDLLIRRARLRRSRRSRGRSKRSGKVSRLSAIARTRNQPLWLKRTRPRVPVLAHSS